MSYYVYGFLYLPESCLALPKGMEKEVELVPYQNIAAVVEANVSIEAIQETEEKLLEAILAHDRVVREIFQQVLSIIVGLAMKNNYSRRNASQIEA